MKWWNAWRSERHPFPAEAWAEGQARVPLLMALPEDDARRLGERAWAFLRRKRLSLFDDELFDLPARLALVAQACLMTLYWSESDAREAFANVHEILVLPEAFRRKVEEMDEAGVVHEYEDERVGETWHQGPIVLALSDIQESGDWDGFNVVIHEFAHKLDMGNSLDADGFPPLPRDIDPRDWHRVFTDVWNDLQAHLERGEATPIDDYAATHPGECFAVCCETFFTAPDVLNAAYPELYALLARYFRQEPLMHLHTASDSMSSQ